VNFHEEALRRAARAWSEKRDLDRPILHCRLGDSSLLVALPREPARALQRARSTKMNTAPDALAFVLGDPRGVVVHVFHPGAGACYVGQPSDDGDRMVWRRGPLEREVVRALALEPGAAEGREAILALEGDA
jgi:hypothetical protein